ncbi:MAG: CoA transferase [Deltaproteobacteria bacterium]|nr:CoA transferase [Deltaproteobacteria bacterium]
MSGFAEWARGATDPAAAAGKPEAFAGIRVVEHCPGHFGGMVAASILAEFGADVVKVEPPGGDPLRAAVPEGKDVAGTGLPFLSEARNRRYVTLSPGRPEGASLLRRLAERADVIVTSEPRERLEEAGIDYLSLRSARPGLIYLALSTYGSFGPDAERPVRDSDILCQALSGAPYIVGEPEDAGNPPLPHQSPTRLGNWHGAFTQGLWGAFGTMAALAFRSATGKGQFVDLAGAEALMQFADYNITWMHTGGKSRERVGNFDPAVFPYTYIRCRDGHTFMAAYNDEAFESLMTIIGRPELCGDPRFSTPSARVRIENERALLAILEEWSGGLTADEIRRAVEEHTSRKGGPGAAVVTGRVNRPLETLAERNWRERGCFVDADDPVYGPLTLAAPPWKMSGTPARWKSGCKVPGADNRDVYVRELGISDEEYRRLASAGII